MKRFAFVFAALISILFVVGFDASASDKGTATFEEKVYDFGTIKEKDGSVSHEFKFTNTGNDNLVIFEATAQCGCTQPHYPRRPIAPGKSEKVKVTFNPKGRSGSFEKVITIRTNGTPQKVRLKIRGNIIPK